MLAFRLVFSAVLVAAAAAPAAAAPAAAAPEAPAPAAPAPAAPAPEAPAPAPVPPAPATRPAAAPGFVIPAGQEQLLGALLEGEPAAPLPGECTLDRATVERSHVAVQWKCAAGPVSLRLDHRDTDRKPLATTKRFALTALDAPPPADFLDAVVARIRAKESDWKWVAAEEAPRGWPWFSPSLPPEGAAAKGVPERLSGADAQAFRQALDRYVAKDAAGAAAALEDLARRHPGDGVLAAFAAFVVAAAPEEAAVRSASTDADARPDDLVAAVRAGAGAWARGERAEAQRERTDFHELAARHLERVAAARPDDARVQALLAVSHHRLGNGARAQEAAAAALARGPADPDARLAASLVKEAVAPAEALQGLAEYLKTLVAWKEAGVPVDEQNLARARELLPPPPSPDPIPQAATGRRTRVRFLVLVALAIAAFVLARQLLRRRTAAAPAGTDAPPATTDAPPATTDAPAASTDAPAATTDAPAATTDAPAATTDTPPAAPEPAPPADDAGKKTGS